MLKHLQMIYQSSMPFNVITFNASDTSRTFRVSEITTNIDGPERARDIGRNESFRALDNIARTESIESHESLERTELKGPAEERTGPRAG